MVNKPSYELLHYFEPFYYINRMLETKFPIAFLLSLMLMAAGLIISGIHPYDRLTWFLEIFPVLLVIPLLVVTYSRFPLSNLLYLLITLHAFILEIGGHYTYARVPIGFWLQDLFDFSRNNFDRIGHLAQGFIPAIALRELLLRTSSLKKSMWLPLLIIGTCLGMSAFYELFEWWVALLLHQSADDFLGTQGDQWDTQWDMFMALIGAIAAVIFLSRAHDKSLKHLRVRIYEQLAEP